MSRSKSGFSLIELLIAIAIIGVLLGLMLVSIQAAREASRRTTCANYLKHYGLGIHGYHDTFQCIPLASTGAVGPPYDPPYVHHGPRISWEVRVLPYTDQMPLFDKIDMRLLSVPDQVIPKPGQPNALAKSHQINYAQCPDDTDDQMDHFAAQGSYCGSLGSQRVESEGAAALDCNPFTVPGLHHEPDADAVYGYTSLKNGLSGVFGPALQKSLTFGDVRDGLSNTFFAGEILGDCAQEDLKSNGWWHVNGNNNTHAATSVPLNTHTTCFSVKTVAEERGHIHPECVREGNGGTNKDLAKNLLWGFRSYHPEGANFLLGDGSVQFIENSINYRIYQGFGGRSDGVVGD